MRWKDNLKDWNEIIELTVDGTIPERAVELGKQFYYEPRKPISFKRKRRNTVYQLLNKDNKVILEGMVADIRYMFNLDKTWQVRTDLIGHRYKTGRLKGCMIIRKGE